MKDGLLTIGLQDNKKTLNVRGKLLDLSVPKVMGILNITPDSFYQGSRFLGNVQELTDRAGVMLSQGASVLDVGGYSTRPGAAEVSGREESERVVWAIEGLKKSFPDCIVSVDSFRAQVAEAALVAGADMINDVAGGDLDEGMFDVVARYKVPYVLMHMRGNPKTMNRLTDYADVAADIIKDLAGRVAVLRARGVADIVVDPGFGFAKTIDQNFELMKKLSFFHQLGCPLLVGISRKTMIWKTLGIHAEEALNGTSVLNTLAVQAGANILRVHDVKEAMEVIKLCRAVVGIA